MSEGLARRVRAIKARSQVRGWEYRQRDLSHGSWAKLRHLYALSAKAYALDETTCTALEARGYVAEAVGGMFQPMKRIYFVSIDEVPELPPTPLRLELGPALLQAARVALVSFSDIDKRLDELATEEVELVRASCLENHAPRLFAEYAWLAEELDSQEALKRAAFWVWLHLVEPPYLSGLGGLDGGATAKVHSVLHRKIIAGCVDFELLAMATYYEQVFTGYAPMLAGRVPDGGILARSTWINRGTMGTYWSSNLANPPR